MVEIKTWLFGVFVAILVFFVAMTAILLNSNHQIKADLATEKQRVEEYKNNQEEKVKAAANNFIKAYMEMDSSQHQTTEDRIEPYTTPEAREKVIPPGESEIVSKIKITSVLSNTKLYYSSKGKNKASVFAKTTRSITVDKGEPTKTNEMIDLQLEFIKNEWLVTDIQVLSQYDEPEGL